ncbi:ANTAR domain-containing protein [Shewanella marinintestina]|uniref:ANTAR domain-containing protein n=1 Tax=Shewanella marinintestina TaxID=190305 RepID=UPI00200FE84A|nr:ANTAR domain-containing protein [Shewanella marinintestina]MCL1145775.1 ANTAR domain-containing protein [Shewanella marinintestina]
MRIISFTESQQIKSRYRGECYVSELSHAGHQLVPVTSLLECERIHFEAQSDLLLLNLKKITESHLAFIARLMEFSPVSLIVCSEKISENQLTCLLECGRITYTPQTLCVSRINAVIDLALLRFKAANHTLSKIEHLEQKLATEQIIYQAKSKLQSVGLNEQQAHQQLQQYAMQQGTSLIAVAKALCK